MTLFIKPLDPEKVKEIQKIFYKYEAKSEMLQKVLEHQEDGTNTEMYKLYAESYEEVAALYKEKFLKFLTYIPEGIELSHSLNVSVNFIYNRLDVQQKCNCDISNIMIQAGFEKI